MNEQENKNEVVPGEEEAKGSIWRLQGIFFEPSATFEDINKKPTFVVALLLTVVIALIGWNIIDNLVDVQELIEAQIKAAPQAEGLSQDQIELQASYTVPFIKWVAPVLIPPLMMLLVAALMLLMAFLTGGTTTFKKLTAVVSYTFFFQTVISITLMVLVFAVVADPEAINLQNPVSSNLGFLFDAEDSPVLYKLASSADVIIWYVIYLLGLGLSKVSEGIKVGKGFALVAVLYLIYVFIGAGWSMIF
jgi:hypothetical protein